MWRTGVFSRMKHKKTKSEEISGTRLVFCVCDFFFKVVLKFSSEKKCGINSARFCISLVGAMYFILQEPVVGPIIEDCEKKIMKNMNESDTISFLPYSLNLCEKKSNAHKCCHERLYYVVYRRETVILLL